MGTTQPSASNGLGLSADELVVALERRELHVLYQPQFGARDEGVVAVEALLRWRHPRHGLVGPIAFLGLAEAHGLMGEITQFALDRACRDARAWTELGLAVNVSPSEFRDGELVSRVERILQSAAFPASRLVIEIVESTAFDDPAAAERQLAQLRALGIRTALDDFGTGHSSLLLLQRLSFDIVKIDKALIGAASAPRARTILRAIIDLAHELGMKVIAEGIETEEQRQILVAAGCDYLQGYLFSKPIEADEIAVMLGRAGFVPPASRPQ
jgi:EAL domain-containing protein (putative c-di-GMP-specific phosphodiesterase class I)